MLGKSGFVLLVALLWAPAFAVAPGGPPPMPDLDVTYISITPREFSYYPNYDLGYGRPVDPNTNNVVDIATAQAIKHYHAPGDIVTFTAHVVNHGGLASAPYNWAFKIDGNVIANGREDTGLGPDAMATVTGQTYTLKGFNGNPNGYTFKTVGLRAGSFKNFTTQWAWQDGQHKVRFEVTPDPSTPAEISTRNNAREDWTDAMGFFITVKKGVSNIPGGTPAPTGYNGFRGTQNFTDSGLAGYPAGAGSYSFEDWLQYHVDLMHDKFAKSIWPASPQGILEHIRIDELLILDDTETNNSAGAFRAVNGFDSGWPFDTYPAANAQIKDWGLIHEWGHQLGLMDIYNMDMIPSENYIKDVDGYPCGLGRIAHQQGMMRGHGDTIFSEYDAIGLNTQLGRRRGWYGDFQYLEPADNRILVLDNAGLPVPNAAVNVYQAKPAYDTPIAQGTTDANGYFSLPNFPVNTVHTNEYKPGASVIYTENNSPFDARTGYIDVVGNHNVLFFRVVSGAKREFFNLDTTDFVRAWASQGTALGTFTLQTHFPTTGSPAPPSGLAAGLTSSTSVHLTWSASPAAGVTGYRVYRADEQEYLWRSVTTTPLPPTATSFVDFVSERQMVRYAVTALVGASESAFGNEVGVYSYADMRGIAEEPDGTVLVADYPREQPVWLRPDFSPIETFGSVHNHVAAVDVTMTANGNVAYVGNPASYVDTPSAAIFVLSPDGANRWSGVFRVNGPNPGQWLMPEGVAPNNAGNLIVTDSGNHRVDITDGYGYGTILEFGSADLSGPVKTIQLPDNTYLTTDRAANRIVRFDASGVRIGTFASITGPAYIVQVGDGTLAVSQPTANKVSILQPDGSLKAEITGASDGSPLKSPQGVTMSQTGELLIADAGNRRVVRVPLIAIPPVGDVDGNGVVNAADALLALRIAAGLAVGTAEQVQRGDIVAGKYRGINMDDVTAILKRVK
ncbi:MAG TPA: hypothetical protein VGM51_18750 [Armatimonadota bacterium]|jgi:sugar lactone lactonase YvrE